MKDLYRVQIGRNCAECKGQLTRILRELDPFPGEADSTCVQAYLYCPGCNKETVVKTTESELRHPLIGRYHGSRFEVSSPEVAL